MAREAEKAAEIAVAEKEDAAAVVGALVLMLVARGCGCCGGGGAEVDGAAEKGAAAEKEALAELAWNTTREVGGLLGDAEPAATAAADAPGALIARTSGAQRHWEALGQG